MIYRKTGYRGLAYKQPIKDSDGNTIYRVTSYSGVPLAEEIHPQGSKPCLCEIVKESDGDK